MTRILATFLLFTTGCVSVGYHQKTLQETRREDLRRVRLWIKDVKLDQMSVYELDDLVRGEIGR